MAVTRDGKRRINLWTATAIAAGSMIGAGVFMKPSSMAGQLGSATLMSVVWVVAGIFSLFGALIFAELGAMFPATGGVYIYFRKIFGDFIAFLYGWSAFSVINTASVAAIAFVCASYLGHFIQLPELSPGVVNRFGVHIPFIGDLYFLQYFGVKLLAVAMVMLLTLLNHLSLRASDAFQVLSTGIKIIVLILLVAGIFFSGKGSTDNFSSVMSLPAGAGLAGGLALALTGAFFAYDGWVNVTFMAGEMQRPGRNIPLSLGIGVIICIIIYVLVNQAYLLVLPLPEMAASDLVAADAIRYAWGGAGSDLVAALIVICTFGAMNGNIMATCRVTLAMGKDGIFTRWTAKESGKYNTPVNALWLHGSWTCLLIMSGSFDTLADMFVFITWIAYAGGAVGVIMLRRRMPDHERPYRTWGYPLVPIIFLIFCTAFFSLTIWSDVTNYQAGRQPVINSLLGVLITVLGIPFYLYGKYRVRTGKVS